MAFFRCFVPLPPTAEMTTMAAPPIAPSAAYEFAWGPSPVTTGGSEPNLPRITPDFSPPLIAMVAVVGTAFLIVLYARILSRQFRLLRRRWRRWRRRRRLLQSTAAASDLESPPPFGGAASFGSSSDLFLSPYGLDDAAIKALPVSLFSRAKAKQLAVTNRECAVCLLEFEDDDTLRTLPLCAHAFHMDCIDVWLRSHATCPLCRAAVLRHEAIFAPMRAARIRPSLDDILLVDPPPDPGGVAILPDPDPDPEITPAAASPLHTEDHFGPRDFLLKRSYSFGFERSLAAERMVLEASTASPWRYRQHRGGFWSKRWPSPFGGSYSASRAPRVFSFRSYRGAAAAATLAKSPAFFKRRGFFPLSSEPSGRLSTGAGPSSRRSRSMTSPSSLLLRPTASSSLAFSSSRIRCGDPEALLSPDRLK
ncbi:RING-H2 finger protein ATL65-like [Musa acuminata AAA Group]|uniref:RING-H2 finger protein ATL65-like n=1 Tax=Musa acuminata AAA Group TaxID=214697 RepID=UPI0031D4F783